MTTVTHPPETNNGVVTSWLPISTAWPSVQPCSTEIYTQIGPGVARAFDPFYGKEIDSRNTCLPPAATLWWSQAQNPALTVTSLGPLICPEMYTTGTTSVVNSLSTFVACCPSGYGFQGVSVPGSVGQCVSPLHVGQQFTFMSAVPGGWNLTTTSIRATDGNVYGIQLNGYIFAPTLGLTSNTSPGGASSTTLTSTQSRGGINKASAAAVGVGVTLTIVGLCALIAGLFLIRRHRERMAATDGLTTNSHGPSPPYSSLEVRTWSDRSAMNSSLPVSAVYEMDVSKKDELLPRTMDVNN